LPQQKKEFRSGVVEQIADAPMLWVDVPDHADVRV
jgi:hypothetical protein